MTDREKFEAYLTGIGSWISLRYVEGDYESITARAAYAAWQASRKQALADAIAICDAKAVAFDGLRESVAAYGCDVCSEAIADLATPEGEQG